MPSKRAWKLRNEPIPPGLPKSAESTWQWILETAPETTERIDLPLLDLLAQAKFQLSRLGFRPRKGMPADEWRAAVRDATAAYHKSANALDARHSNRRKPRTGRDHEGKPPAAFGRLKRDDPPIQ